MKYGYELSGGFHAGLTLALLAITILQRNMSEPYRLSFTFGGLLFPETVVIAQRYRELPDWEALKAEATRGELLRKTRASSRYRYFREIRDRFTTAWPFEMELLAAEGLGARLAAFVICCRYYQVLGDFVREVVRDKVAMQEPNLAFSDYYHFLEGKRYLHPELTALSESTQAKLRQVMFRMLAEGTILEKGREHRIKVPTLPGSLVHRYEEHQDRHALDCLLYHRGGGAYPVIGSEA